jgi:iron(III) transport system permease protein
MPSKLKKLASAQGILLSSSLFGLLIFCTLPFITLIEKILFSGEGGAFSLDAFRATLTADSTQTAVLNTLWVAGLVTFLSVLVGVPLAWILSRSNFPRAQRFRSLLCLPFAIPPYIGAIAWIYLANPTTGLLNKILGTSFFNIYSMTGLVFVEASFLYTFILLTTLASLDRMDSSLEEAARLSGASPLRVFKDVTLPLIYPSILSGALLVFLATAASFGVPSLIGGPARIYLMTTQIYTFQRMGSMTGLIQAGALSSVLMLTAFLILMGAQWVSKRSSKHQTVSGKTARPSVFDLGRYRTPLFVLVVGFLGLVFFLPTLSIVFSSLSRVQGELSFSNLTLGNWYRVLFEVDETGRALFNSLVVSAGAATLAVMLGLLISYIQVKTRWPGRGLLDLLASIPYATPGTVVALALILQFSGRFLGVFPSLYNTLALIMIAYFVKYLSFAIKTTSDGYRQVDDVLAEAARVSGATWAQTMTTIWLPLLKPAIAAAWFLVFMPAMSELSMTILLTGPGLETLGTLIFDLQNYGDASGGGASVLALIVISSVMGINTIVKKLSKGRYGL